MLENMVNEVVEEVVENGVNEVVEEVTDVVADEVIDDVVETTAGKKVFSTKTKIIAGCVAGGVIAGLTVGTIMYKKSKKSKAEYEKLLGSLDAVSEEYDKLFEVYGKDELPEGLVKAGELLDAAHSLAESKKSIAKKEKQIRDMLASACAYIDDFTGIEDDLDEE